MALDSGTASGKKLDHIRLDCIGRAAGNMELWWVATAFTDESTEPQGMFVGKADAEKHANELAASLGVKIVITHFEDKQ